MKIKAIMCAAIAALAFSSCSQDEDVTAAVQPKDSKVITFNPSVLNAAGTRATPVTPENYVTTMKDFAVFAVEGNVSTSEVFNGGNFFMGSLNEDNKVEGLVKITNDGAGNWNYADPAQKSFWPNAYNVSKATFFAFSPADAEVTLTREDGSNTFSVLLNVNSDGYASKDIMFATATVQNGQRVDLVFKHVLAQVSFKGKTSNNNLQVEVKDVTMNHVNMSAWAERYSVNGDLTLHPYSNLSDVNLGLRTPVSFEKSTGIVSLNDDNGVAMVVPQQASDGWRNAWDPKKSNQPDGFYLSIRCKIKYKGQYVVGSDTEYGTIYQPFAPNWESGKKYVYTLDFNGAGYDENGEVILKPISYGVSVTDWDASPGETAVNVN